jgi:8-oxo-dGTP pyrophosphatase MutT (NUDIX family)
MINSLLNFVKRTNFPFMIIFLNDRPVSILRASQFDASESSHFDLIFDLRLTKPKVISFSGHVLLLNVTPAHAVQIVEALDRHPTDLLSVTMICDNKKEVADRIKAMYKVMKAAGGVVLKDNKWLLMYRRKKWDLPKGKLDRGEKSKAAAVREIEEETGVKAKVRGKICTTWHTYTFQNSRILKRTKWYVLECIDDTAMQPQAEEDIEKLEWLPYVEVQKILVNSYSSIRFVAEYLHKKQVHARSM